MSVCSCKRLYRIVEIVSWLTIAAAPADIITLLINIILKSAKLDRLHQMRLSKIFCTAVFGESFSYGDSMASPFRDVPIHWLLNASTMRHKIDWDVFKNMDVFEDVTNSKSMRVRYDNFSYRMKNNLGGHLTSELDTNYFFYFSILF